jgi:hypothetical protein
MSRDESQSYLGYPENELNQEELNRSLNESLCFMVLYIIAATLLYDNRSKFIYLSGHSGAINKILAYLVVYK